MEEKRYGVKVTLLKELGQFQLSLRNRRVQIMPCINNALVSFNNAEFIETVVQAEQGVLSIGDTMNYLIKSTTIISHSQNHIDIQWPGLKIIIYFQSQEIKEQFVSALGTQESTTSSSGSTSPDSRNQ